MQSLICKYFTWRNRDRSNKTFIRKAYHELLISQKWSYDEIQKLQLEKLKKLVRHCYKNVPFYTELFDKNNLKPEHIQVLDDINKIPVITKEDVKNAGESIYAIEYEKTPFFKSKTGGTTGVPLVLIKDAYDISITWGAFLRWLNWMGVDYWNKSAKIWGSDKVLHTSFKERIVNFVKDFIYNRTIINSFNINETNIEQVITKINRQKPKFIRGYLSALIQIAEYMKKSNIRLNYIPKAVSPTTETLLPPYRKLLEEIFEAPVYDQYGCGECNSMAYECSAHEGMHEVSEHTIIQVLNESNKPVNDINGRIILTNLDNYSMPFLRYENGDSGIKSSGKCSCGMQTPIIKQISGRSADTIITKDGSKVHGVFFTDILYELFENENKSFSRFQVIQSIPGDIEFILEFNQSNFNDYNEKILEALKLFFNNIKVSQANKLENDSSGKFRYVISKINN